MSWHSMVALGENITDVAEKAGMIIEAESGIEYDLNTNITVATKNVRMTRENLSIEADRVVYDGNTGIVEASGHVCLKQSGSEYHTDTLKYNMRNSAGDSEDFNAFIKGESRSFIVTGRNVHVDPNHASVGTAVITRCPKTKPDYTLSARYIEIIGKKIRLKQVVLRLKGIPIFYFPVLSFYTDHSLPEVEPTGYDGKYGAHFRFKYLISSDATSEWVTKGELYSKGSKSYFGFGKKTVDGPLNNEFDFSYYMDGYLKLEDQYTYTAPSYAVTLDASRDFSSHKRSEAGLAITRNSWDSPVGQWQVGVTGRWVSALDSCDNEYGGIYSGLQVDYRPLPNIGFTYLGIRSHTAENYGDFMEDFGTGSNLLYNLHFALNPKYSLTYSGTYNLTDSAWFARKLMMTIEDCCLVPTFGYNFFNHSFEGSLNIKF